MTASAATITPADIRLFIQGRWDWSPQAWLEWAMQTEVPLLASAVEAVSDFYDETLDEDAEAHYLAILAAFHVALATRVEPTPDAPTLEELSER
jgi:hypothetical protein